MRTFNKNYLYELPEDIQFLIFKKVFNNTLNLINDNRDVLDNYNKLVDERV